MRPSGSAPSARRLDWDAIDPVAVVRGASTSFSVLVLGGLLHPVLIQVAYPLAFVWIPLVAIAAFAVAGMRAASSPWPALGGAAAALSGYFLVLPLVLFAGVGWDPGQLVATAITAVLVGGSAAAVRARLTPHRETEAQKPEPSTSSRRIGR